MVNFRRGSAGKSAETENVGGMSFDPPPQAETHSPSDVMDDAEAEAASLEDAADGTIVDGGIVSDIDDDVSSMDIGSVTPENVQPATSRFARRPKVAKVKSVKAPKVKRISAKKAAKGVDRAVDDYPIPVMMIIEFYEGLTKESEAEQLGRAMIEKNFDAPNASYVYTQKWRKGIAVEVQEGGGEAYLPEILAKLDEDPDAILAVPMSNRIAQVRLDGETGRLEMLLLLNNQEPPEIAFVPLPTKVMKPFDRRGSRLFIAGIAVLSSAVAAALFSVGAFFIDTNAWALPYVQQTDVKTLPMAQLSQMKVSKESGDCLFKAEFAAGSWKMTPGFNSNGTCVKDRPFGEAAVAVDPTVVIQPGGAGTPGVAVPGSAVGVPPVAAVPGAVVPGGTIVPGGPGVPRTAGPPGPGAPGM